MTYGSEELILVVRESRREARRQARRRLLEAALTGRGIDMADVAAARGMVLRERENSIFSDAWIPLSLTFVLAGLLANRNLALLTLGSSLLIIVGLSTLWKNVALFGVTYERSFDRTRVFPGETVEMSTAVCNNKILPLSWLQFRDELPIAPESESRLSRTASEVTGRFTLQQTFSLQGKAKSLRRVKLRFVKRGYYHLGPVTYASGDPFTLFTIERQHKDIDTLVVYPQIWPLDALGLPAKEPFGGVRVRQSLFTDPIKTQGTAFGTSTGKRRHAAAVCRREFLSRRLACPWLSSSMWQPTPNTGWASNRNCWNGV
jgi:hypothetical protein